MASILEHSKLLVFQFRLWLDSQHLRPLFAALFLSLQELLIRISTDLLIEPYQILPVPDF